MTKILFSISLWLCALTLQAQDVEPIQHTLITKHTATWCSNCGGWGWNLFDGIVSDNADKAFFFAAHASGDLQSDIAEDITSTFGALGQPVFFVNENNIVASSSSATTKRIEVQNTVNAAYDAMPTVAVGVEAFWDEDNEEILVNTKTKFFQDASGTYRVAVYLVEDGVVNFQASQGANAVHKHVLRESFTNDPFGTNLAPSEFSTDDEFVNVFTLPYIGNPMDKNFEYVSVIWKVENGDFAVENVNGTTEIETLIINSVEEITTRPITIYPTLFEETVTVEMELSTAIEEVVYTLHTITGQVVFQEKVSGLNAGGHIQTLQLPTDLNSGTYLLQIDLDGNAVTKKLVK